MSQNINLTKCMVCSFLLLSLVIFFYQNAIQTATIRWLSQGISQTIFRENPKGLRLQKLKHWCETRNQTKTNCRPNGCWAYPTRRIIVCTIPKVACSTWRTLMIISTEKFGRRFPQWKNITKVNDKILQKIGYVHDKLRSYGWIRITDCDKVNGEFQGYFKVIFVREPYDRLLSAYVNKVQSWMGVHVNYRKTYIRRLRARFGNNVTDLENITFNAFLHNVVYEYENDILDQHWTPYTKLLDPCPLDFDLIGRFETMEKDARVVLKHLFDRNFSLPVTNKTPSRNVTAYYDNVDRAVLRKIRQYFYDDFLAYGYDPDLHT